MKDKTDGFVKINENVIASVAVIAASEVEGVVKYAYGKSPRRFLKSKSRLSSCSTKPA